MVGKRRNQYSAQISYRTRSNDAGFLWNFACSLEIHQKGVTQWRANKNLAKSNVRRGPFSHRVLGQEYFR
jgi:hypothetical protein